MPFKIVREDITKIKCDAIVNPTNEDLYPGGGVDAAIHQAAGKELLDMCQSIGGLNVGRAKITPGKCWENTVWIMTALWLISASGIIKASLRRRVKCLTLEARAVRRLKTTFFIKSLIPCAD